MKFLLASGFLVCVLLLAGLASMHKRLGVARRHQQKLAAMNGPIRDYFSSPEIRPAASSPFAFDSARYELKSETDKSYADSAARLWAENKLPAKSLTTISAAVHDAYQGKALADLNQGFLLATFHVYDKAFDSILYSGDRDRFATWIFNGSVIMEREYRDDSIRSRIWSRKPQ